MSLFSYIWKQLRRYFLSPESFFLIVCVIVLYNTLVNISPLWQKAKEKLRFAPHVFSRPKSDNLYWPTDPSQSSWDFKEKNVAAYSIKGRRPHMEDRFQVHQGVNGSKISLFGIFDGHGGEVTWYIFFFKWIHYTNFQWYKASVGYLIKRYIFV